MFKKLIAAGATLAVALGIVALATVPAQAHTPSVKATCSTLSVDLENYNGQAGHQNSVTVTVDGTQVDANPNFGTTFKKTYGFDQSKSSHTYEVKVVAWDDPTNQHGYSPDDKGTVSDCTRTGTPPTIDHSNGACTGAGTWSNGSYTIPSSNDYTVQQNRDGQGFATVTPGTYHDATNGETFVWRGLAKNNVTPATVQLGTWNVVTPTGHDCDRAATPPTVNVTHPVCAAPGQPGTGSVRISGVNGSVAVSYSTTGKNGAYTTITSDTTVTVAAQGTVWVQVIAQPGYTLATTDLPYAVGGPTDSDCVAPVQPTVQQAVCDEDAPGTVPEAFYMIPTVEGVVYKDAQGAVLKAGKHDVTVGTTDVTVKVFASSTTGYPFAGSADPTEYDLVFSHLSSAGCVLGAAVGIPTFTEAVCDATHPGTFINGASYTLPAATGVVYDVKVGGAAVQQDVAPGTYPVDQGDVVVVTERPAPGFSLSGDYPAGGYAHTFSTSAGDCTTVVTPVAGATDQTCTPDSDGIAVFTQGSITVTVTAHVTYAIDGTTVDTTGAKVGEVVSTTVQPGNHTVSVTTDTGYVVSGWPKVFTVNAAAVCGDLPSHALVTPTFDPHQAGCFTQASFTLGELNGDDKNVIWTVNGSTLAAGTYPAKTGTTYTAVATATKGNAIAPFAQSTFTFTPNAGAAGPCDLKTLALTGTGNPAGWIGLGYLLLITGLALAAVPMIRRRRAAE